MMIMNIRNAYDQKLEQILDFIDYQNSYDMEDYFNKTLMKPSYLDYNFKNKLPKTKFNSDYEKVMYEYHLQQRKKIVHLEELECLELLKEKLFPNIYKIKTDMVDDYDRIDFHEPDFNLFIDHKGRSRQFHEEDGGMTLDRPKYEELMKEENGYILNSTPIGIFIWNVKLLGDIEWIKQDKTPTSTRFNKPFSPETEECEITYLTYEKCNDLTYLLLR